MDLRNLTLAETLLHLKNGSLTSENLVEYYLGRIEQINKDYNVYLFVRDKGDLLNEAKEADQERAKGSSKRLLGIPFSLKDTYMATGTPTTAGDLYLKDAFSEYNAAIVQKLLDEGAILIGKVNMDAWGFGSSTENSSYGVTRNPYDKDRVAGGSSGGSAASLVLDTCSFSMGEDTGGSVRNPASFCGVYALKPTYGRISRFGCVAYASSLDTVGPMARSAEDLGIIFDVLKEVKEGDMMVDSISNYQFAINNEIPNPKSQIPNEKAEAWKTPPLKGGWGDVEQSVNSLTREPVTSSRFAFSYDFIPSGISEDVKRAYLETIEKFKAAGFEPVEKSFSTFKYCIPTYYITAMSEASTNLARYNGTRYGNSRFQIPNSKDKEQRAESKEQRTENREQRTENREQRTENREQRIKNKEHSLEVSEATRNSELRTLNSPLNIPLTPFKGGIPSRTAGEPVNTNWQDLYKYSRTLGFNKEAKRRVFLGSYILSEGYYDAYYKKAQKIRNLIAKEISSVLEDVDFILSPVTPTPAMKIGEKTSDPVAMYLEDIYTVTANLAGIPALAFPAGLSKEGLPIGMQVMGEKFGDEELIEIVEKVSKNREQRTENREQRTKSKEQRAKNREQRTKNKEQRTVSEKVC